MPRENLKRRKRAAKKVAARARAQQELPLFKDQLIDRRVDRFLAASALDDLLEPKTPAEAFGRAIVGIRGFDPLELAMLAGAKRRTTAMRHASETRRLS